MKQILMAAILIMLAVNASTAASNKIAKTKQQPTKTEAVFENKGDCLAPSEWYANAYERSLSPDFAGYGKACRQAEVSDEDALARVSDLAKRSQESKLYAMRWFLTGWTENAVKPSGGVETHIEGHQTTYTTDTGLRVITGSALDVFHARIENSQLGIDKDLAMIAAKRGVKVIDKNVVSKLLTRALLVSPLMGVPKQACEFYKAGREAFFAGALGYLDAMLSEGLHSIPVFTSTFIKLILNGKDSDFTIEKSHLKNCANVLGG